jgi:transcriptional regulator with PAS, ATPase and Fis domain
MTKTGGQGRLTDELLALEKKILKTAISRCRSTRALASELGISQPTVVRKLKKHALSLN